MKKIVFMMFSSNLVDLNQCSKLLFFCTFSRTQNPKNGLRTSDSFKKRNHFKNLIYSIYFFKYEIHNYILLDKFY